MRHFGKFTSEKEAVEWITDHPWLTDRQTENTVAERRAADQPSPRTLSRRPKFRQGAGPGLSASCHKFPELLRR
jgi:hypothetical protein